MPGLLCSLILSSLFPSAAASVQDGPDPQLLALIEQLRQWKVNGAVATKFTIAS
jgi:hypothetical protein